jgi:hypothetical protein
MLTRIGDYSGKAFALCQFYIWGNLDNRSTQVKAMRKK